MEYKEGMTLKEFVEQKKARGLGKLNADYSTKDYLRYYKHTVWRYQGGCTQAGNRRKRMAKGNKWILTPAQYKKIITSINSLLLEAISKGEDIELPEGFGTLYARQKSIYTKLDTEGRLKTNRAIDWNSTMKLWFEDKESREAKQVVYYDNCKAKPYVNIMFGDFTNKRFLEFRPVHNVMRKIAQGISNGNIILPDKGERTKAIKDIQQ